MHEWALAEAVLDAAEKAAKSEKLASVDEIIVSLGELQQIETGAFQFSFNEILKSGYPFLAGAKLKIVREPAGFKCKSCGKSIGFGEIKKKMGAEESEFIHFIPEMAHVYMRCENCKSPDFDVTSGRGVYIKELLGEK